MTRSSTRWWPAYLVLTKARLSVLVLLTTAVGFVAGAATVEGFDAARLAWTLLGTALAAGSANALNQVIEIARDRAMHRTCRRPLPTGAMGRPHAIATALGLGVGGLALLVWGVGELAMLLAGLTIVIYVAWYTPMKTRSTLNTLVGALCGATPPIIGWVGATGRIDAGAWALGALLFVWQIPHFLALAWLYRKDYRRGRFKMLPTLDPSGRLTGQIVVLTSLMLIPLALTIALLGVAGWAFAIGATLLGLGLGIVGLRLYLERTDASARRMFLASLVYLTAVMLLLVADLGAGRTPDTIHRLASTSTLELAMP